MRLPYKAQMFLDCTRIGIAQAFAEKMIFVGNFVVYATIMIVYGGVIHMIPEADIAPYGLTHDEMLWYLGTTELVIFSGSGWIFKEVQNDLLSGNSDLALVRPYSDSLFRVGIWFGRSLAQGVMLFPAYILFMLFMAGQMTMDVQHMLGLIASIPLAIFIMLCAAYVIGVSCLWFVQAEPASWIWQKAVFLFSALLWPVLLYPQWLQTIIWFTPFPALLMLAGNWTLDLPAWWYGLGFAHQLLWTFLFYKLMELTDRAVLRRIQTGDR